MSPERRKKGGPGLNTHEVGKKVLLKGRQKVRTDRLQSQNKKKNAKGILSILGKLGRPAKGSVRRRWAAARTPSFDQNWQKNPGTMGRKQEIER